MSYILDALNKSSKEQSPDKPPDINSYALVSPGTASGRPWILSIVILTLIVVNGAGLGFWLIKNGSSSEEANTKTGPNESPIVASQQQSVNVPQVIRPSSVKRQTSQLTSQPAHIRQLVSNLSFSSHIYSEYPDLRAVSINGKRFTEMEMITSELQLEQVTPNGVILGYESQRFEVDILNNWPD
ncbi:MAG: general secretion pathway protein GspB [Gammaproteobacteria bacterium]|nr:general secretion pathway protein GspB [Gammaproteobacteria bacterium]